MSQFIRKYKENVLKILIISFIIFIEKELKTKNVKKPRIKEGLYGVKYLSNLTFVAGLRGNPKLVLDGYSFVKNKGNDKLSYWRCASFRRLKCPAKAMTDASGYCTITVPQHNHTPDVEK